MNVPYEHILNNRQAQYGLKFKIKYKKEVVLRFMKVDGLR